MMKRVLFLSLLLWFPVTMAGELQNLYSELAQLKPKTEEPKTETSTKLPGGLMMIPRVQAEPREAHGITEIAIERTRCLVNCPAYTLVISADGSFRYTGEYAVERIGDHTGTISVGRLNQILDFIHEADYMNLKDDYSSSYLDSATTYTMVVKNNETKVIQNYANSGPATLWAIETLIDSLLESAEWTE